MCEWKVCSSELLPIMNSSLILSPPQEREGGRGGGGEREEKEMCVSGKRAQVSCFR